MTGHDISRRHFLLSSSAVAGGLLIAEKVSAGAVVNLLDPGSPLMIPENFSPSVWFTMQSSGETTIHVYRQELGQHIGTALAQIVAEELDLNWEKVNIDYPVVDMESFARTGRQLTGGSNSVRESFEPLSRAASIARQFLVEAAANIMGAEIEDCYTENGVVIDPIYDQQLTYAEILGQTSIEHEIQPEDLASVTLKSKEDYKIIGTPVRALDLPEKVNGKARYSIDARVPNMVYGKVSLAPTRLGSSLTYVNDAVAREEVNGYLQTLALSTNAVPGRIPESETELALVLAESFPAAMRAEKSIEVNWDVPEQNLLDSSHLYENAKTLIEQGESYVYVKVGDFNAARGQGEGRYVAEYQTSMIEHAALEPRSAVVQNIDGVFHIYSGHHNGDGLIVGVAKELGVSSDKVVFHPHMIGGSFGDKIYADQIVAAAKACQTIGRPVKVILTREDQFNLGHPKPISHQKLEASIDTNTKLSPTHRLRGLRHDLVAGKCMPFSMPGQTYTDADASEPSKVEMVPGAGGVVSGLDNWYDLQNLEVNYYPQPLMNQLVPVGFVRSVGNFFTIFAIESFFDEVAHQLGADPLDLRLDFLKGRGRNAGANAHEVNDDGSPGAILRGPQQVTVDGGRRLANVLKIAAGQANYASSLKGPNVAQGIAVAGAENRRNPTFAACVADVEGLDSGALRVKKLTVCADVGVAINPEGIRSQIEGSLLWGLSSATYEQATLQKGRLLESNFDAYKWQRNGSLPELDIHIVENGVHPTGIGENTLSLVAPAICNAIYNLTEKRIRSLPLRNHIQLV
ncbi:MAG: molybdopterin cofactor-binding domain-containing protein [Pseudomonadota bacterium]|nr:molybdopterin cofactor-binding domain-containing protein [Pseudomonadota bacterium]